jgi:hypothetical protein
MRRPRDRVTLFRENWFLTIRDSGLTRELTLSNNAPMVAGEIERNSNDTLPGLGGFKA